MKIADKISVVMGLGLIIAAAPRAPGQVPAPAEHAVSPLVDASSTQPAKPDQAEAGAPPVDSPQDFKILDLKSRRAAFDETRKAMRKITLSPEFKPRKALLRNLKNTLEASAADPTSELFQKTNAAYHDTFAAVAEDFNDYLKRQQEKAPAMMQEFSNLASAMGSVSSELSSNAAALESQATGLANQQQEILEQLRATARTLGKEVVDQNKSLTPEQQKILIEAQETVDGVAAKERVVRKNAEDLRHQAQLVDQQLRQLLARKGQYEKFIRNAKRAQALLGDIVRWQNDRAKVAELQARLSGINLSGPDLDIQLDLPGPDLIPNSPSGPVVIEQNKDERQALDILNANRSQQSPIASNKANPGQPAAAGQSGERSKK